LEIPHFGLERLHTSQEHYHCEVQVVDEKHLEVVSFLKFQVDDHEQEPAYHEDQMEHHLLFRFGADLLIQVAIPLLEGGLLQSLERLDKHVDHGPWPNYENEDEHP
jgi:hypothetical protein